MIAHPTTIIHPNGTQVTFHGCEALDVFKDGGKRVLFGTPEYLAYEGWFWHYLGELRTSHPMRPPLASGWE